MLAASAEFEHDLALERTCEGLAADGCRGGGVVKRTETKAAQARLMYDAEGHRVAQIAVSFGVSCGSIYGHISVTV